MVGMQMREQHRVDRSPRHARARTTPVEVAEIARDAGVPHLVITHMVPPLRNALMRRMFMRGVAGARGDGDTLLGFDGLLITLPLGSKAMTTKKLF
jgi:ribonuclease Z